jgi:apolipoprotein N-acyltransferase
LAVVAAFYWSPKVLAYTMDSSYRLGLLVFVPLALWDATRIALPFLFAAKFARDSNCLWLIAGLFAVVLESVVPSVFPFRLGYTQIHWAWMIQASDLFGPEWPTLALFAMGGAIMAMADALGRAIRTRSFAFFPADVLRSSAVWLSVLNVLYGVAAMIYWSDRIVQAPSLRVALVQVDPSFRESTDNLRRLTATVSKTVDLVCWPESSGGTYDLALEALTDEPFILARSRDPERGMRPWPHPDCPLLLGGKSYVGDREKPDKLFQSAMLIDRNERIVGRYQKRCLMPFGEYVPGSGWIPGIDKLFSIEEEISAGQAATVLSTEHGARIGAMLCYEDMVPGAARTLTNERANLLVSLINGSAFTNPLTLAQHRLLAQLRTVECRRSLLRCSATGETCVISPLGQIARSLEPQTQAVLCATVPLLETRTIYCRFGEFLPMLCLLALVVIGFRKWQLMRRVPPSPPDQFA